MVGLRDYIYVVRDQHSGEIVAIYRVKHQIKKDDIDIEIETITAPPDSCEVKEVTMKGERFDENGNIVIIPPGEE